MVDSHHVARAEATAEEADERREQVPPQRRSDEETADDQHAAQHGGYILGTLDHTHTHQREEGEQVGDDGDEVGQREGEHRGEVAPYRSAAGAVTPDLRQWVLEENIDTDGHDKDSSKHAQDKAVLLDLRLQHRVEEEGDDGHHRIGTRHTHSTGPTVIDEASPTTIPRTAISMEDNNILSYSKKYKFQLVCLAAKSAQRRVLHLTPYAKGV